MNITKTKLSELLDTLDAQSAQLRNHHLTRKHIEFEGSYKTENEMLRAEWELDGRDVALYTARSEFEYDNKNNAGRTAEELAEYLDAYRKLRMEKRQNKERAGIKLTDKELKKQKQFENGMAFVIGRLRSIR